MIRKQHPVQSLPTTPMRGAWAKSLTFRGPRCAAGAGLTAQPRVPGRVGTDPAVLPAWITLGRCLHLAESHFPIRSKVEIWGSCLRDTVKPTWECVLRIKPASPGPQTSGGSVSRGSSLASFTPLHNLGSSHEQQRAWETGPSAQLGPRGAFCFLDKDILILSQPRPVAVL